MIRAVVDTQVWVRAFLRPMGSAGAIHQRLLEGRFECLTTELLLSELTEVVRRPKFARKHGRSRELQRNFVHQLRAAATLLEIEETVSVCRDPDDDVVISVAVVGAAAYVISADQDLHATEVTEYLMNRGIEVLTVPEFLAVLRNNQEDENGGDVAEDA